MSDEALKPCPHCGGSVTIQDCGKGDLFVSTMLGMYYFTERLQVSDRKAKVGKPDAPPTPLDELIAQDADLLEKTSPLSNERDAGQPWLRTYDAHLKRRQDNDR